jgi:hypothetical protein
VNESDERPGRQPGNPLDSSEPRHGSGAASATEPILSGGLDTPAPVGSDGTVGSQGSATGDDSSEPGRRPGRGIRVRTVVFGLVLLAISASVLVALLTTARVDATAVAFVVLIGAGAALLAGGVAAAVREARGGPGA